MNILPPISEDDKMLAGFPYVVWPIGSLFILASRKKEDPFLYYHAVQALLVGALLGFFSFLLIAFLFICFRFMPGSSSYIPTFFSLGFLFAGGFAVLAVLLTAIFLGWRATEGEMLRIPFIGDFAEEKMLDQTGMTRRDFEAMLIDSVATGPSEDVEVQFPDFEEAERSTAALGRSARPQPPQETAIDRLEATRRAQAERQRKTRDLRAEASQSKRAPVNKANSHPTEKARPSGKSWEESRPKVRRTEEGSVVKDVDLIGHYKEKEPKSSQKRNADKDVLRNWLTSVDSE